MFCYSTHFVCQQRLIALSNFKRENFRKRQWIIETKSWKAINIQRCLHFVFFLNYRSIKIFLGASARDNIILSVHDDFFNFSRDVSFCSELRRPWNFLQWLFLTRNNTFLSKRRYPVKSFELRRLSIWYCALWKR